MKLIKNIKRFLFILRHLNALKLLILNFTDGYLYETGWTKSAIEGKPVDKDGNPLPWISIPTIEILKEKNLSELFVFEYGSGFSTIWFSEKVKKIVSIEHDKNWFNIINSALIKNKNCDIIFKNLKYGGEYSKEIKKYNNIDIVIIDGRDRTNCLLNSVSQLSEKGIIILDDSQRENYQKAIEEVKKTGFKTLNLVGMNVGRPMKKITTIFYREKNCLGL